MNEYFFSRSRRFRGDIKVKLDLSNYATKTDLKNLTHVDVSSFASKTNLASLKTGVDKIDVEKLKTVPADLAKLTNKVAHDLVEETDFNALEKIVIDNKTGQYNLETTVQNNHLTTKTSINNLKTKVNSIDLTKYVKKSDYDTKVGNLELKISDISSSVKWGLLACNEVGLFQIFNHLKLLKTTKITISQKTIFFKITKK